MKEKQPVLRMGPLRSEKRIEPYLPPRHRKRRINGSLELPAAVRIQADMHGDEAHEFLQHDGRWQRCGGPGRCRECIREEEMKTTKQRIREALCDHFGRSYLATIADDTGLFPTEVDDTAPGRRLGDHLDRVEMLIAVEAEFQIRLPEDLTAENPTVDYLASIVDDLVAANRA
jgi:acyl carrier protein